MTISNGGLETIPDFPCLIMKLGEQRDMDGAMWSIMIIGGDIFILMTTFSEERISQITHIGAEELGETSIGGGIEKHENCMIKSTNHQKVTLDGGMVYQTIRIYLLIIWTFLHHGSDTMRIFQDFGDEIEPHPIG